MAAPSATTGSGADAMAGRLPTSRTAVLSHHVRRAIVDLVRRKPGISPQEVGEELDLCKSALGHHRRKLKEAGILREGAVGRRVTLTVWGSAPTLPAPTLRGSMKDVARQVVGAGADGLTAEEIGAAVGLSLRAARDCIHRMVSASLLAADRGKPARFRATKVLHELLGEASDSTLDEKLR